VTHVVLALLLIPQAAADPANGWQQVEHLSAGTRIYLTYAGGRSEDRLVEGANESRLTLRGAGKRPVSVETVPRECVLEIAVEHRRRSPAGAIIGGVGGFFWGVSLSGLQCKSGGCALGIGLVDGILGALLGHAVSPVHVTHEIIYRANQPGRIPI
jgi:hypothetical protein